MPRLPRVTAKEVIRALEKLGFTKVRQKGSHLIMKDSKNTQLGCVIPVHSNKTLATGTIKNILRQAGVSTEQFMDLL